jgi:hypothetical protein
MSRDNLTSEEFETAQQLMFWFMYWASLVVLTLVVCAEVYHTGTSGFSALLLVCYVLGGVIRLVWSVTKKLSKKIHREY